MKITYKQLSLFGVSVVVLASSVSLNILFTDQAQALRAITFPIIGSASYSNDYDAPRASGPHHATDIFANKMQKVVSPVDGIVTFVPTPQPSYGYMITIRDSDNYRYNFIHLNNDTPGTDDGRGKEMFAYAPDMKSGNPVVKGQHIGYVGDSGNAETTPPHLHFEIIDPNGNAGNPYNSLLRAPHISKPVLPPALPNELLPYGIGFMGGVNIAKGNFDADPESEIITAPSSVGGPHVKIFDDDNTYLGGFFASTSTPPGGIDVAAGDVDGDGIDEVITAVGSGGAPEVKVFKLNKTLVSSFLAYASTYRDGVRVTAGDVDGDGNDEIITGTGAGSAPVVNVFETNGTVLNSFLAYSSTNRDGIDVAAGNVAGLVADEIITSAGAGSGPQVKVFQGNGTVQTAFFAYDTTFRGGVKVSAGDMRTSTPLEEIATLPASVGGGQVKMFEGTGAFIRDSLFLESWWRGSFDIGGGYDSSHASTGGNRRGSVRLGVE